MLCDKCTTIIDDKFNKVCYSCGHRYHRTCLLLNKYSLLNPSCSICDDGKIIRNSLQYDFTPLRIENAHGNVTLPVINCRELGNLYVQRCKNLEKVVESVASLEEETKEVVESVASLVKDLEEEDLDASLEEDLEVDEVAILEFGKKELFHSSKILCIIFCTVYFFTPFLNS